MGSELAEDTLGYYDGLNEGYTPCSTYKEILKYPLVLRAIKSQLKQSEESEDTFDLEDEKIFDGVMRKIFSCEDNIRLFYKVLREEFLKITNIFNVEFTEDIFSGIEAGDKIKIPQVSQIVSLVLIVDELQEFYDPKSGKPGQFDFSKSTTDIPGTNKRRNELINILEEGFIIDDEGDTLESSEMMGENHITMGFADEDKTGRAGINRKGEGIRDENGEYIELSGKVEELFGVKYFQKEGKHNGYVDEKGKTLKTSEGYEILQFFGDEFEHSGKKYNRVKCRGFARSVYINNDLSLLKSNSDLIIEGTISCESEYLYGIKYWKVDRSLMLEKNQKDEYLSELGDILMIPSSNERVTYLEKYLVLFGGDDVLITLISDERGRLYCINDEFQQMKYDGKEVSFCSDKFLYSSMQMGIVKKLEDIPKGIQFILGQLVGRKKLSKLDSSKITFE